MTKLLDGDAAHLNVVWYDPATAVLEDVQIGDLMKRSRPMAMLAVNINEIVATVTALPVTDYHVVVHHSPATGAAFCLAPADGLAPEDEVLAIDALKAFFSDFAIFAEAQHTMESIDAVYCQVAFSDAGGLARALEAYCADNDDLYTPAQVRLRADNDPQLMRAAGEDFLADAWVFAVMGDAPQASRDGLLMRAMQTAQATVPFDFHTIRAEIALADKRAAQNEKAGHGEPSRGLYAMRLH